MLKLEGFYIWVDDLDEAISFYEKVLEQKVVNREKDRWADFRKNGVIGLGIYNYTIDSSPVKYGNNVTPELRTPNVQSERERIIKLNPKNISEIITLEQPVLYKYFQFEDK